MLCKGFLRLARLITSPGPEVCIILGMLTKLVPHPLDMFIHVHVTPPKVVFRSEASLMTMVMVPPVMLPIQLKVFP